jgi:DNA-binding LacI/PurR family transcriptional regulator
MPTIMDVARLAGVGIGTVSRVLNGSPLVSAVTRQRVLAAIERLGYRPSPIARAFGRRRTAKLELLVPLVAQSFVLEVLRGIEDALADTDYTLLLRTVESVEQRDQIFDECCTRGRADGVVIVWMPPTERFVLRLSAEAFPAVLLNAVHPHVSSVGVDHDAAARSAVAYCVGLGHTRVALVDRPVDPFNSASNGVCQRGYRLALADAGLSVLRQYERITDLSAAAGAAALDALAALPQPPSAIVAGSDTQALGILEAARSRGWRVPAEVSVVGYNDSDLTQDLGLTTVRIPLREMGRQATDALLAILAEPGADPVATYLPTELVVRQTCGAPAAQRTG